MISALARLALRTRAARPTITVAARSAMVASATVTTGATITLAPITIAS